MSIIVHPNSNIRIFRPNEIIAIQNAIPRAIDLERFNTLLYTGCRYTEFQDLFGKHNRFDTNGFLKVKNTKAKVKDKFRYVRLSDNGIHTMKRFFKHDKKPSKYGTWDENMRRWVNLSGIERDKKDEQQLINNRDINPRCGEYNDIVSLKSLRKTWESWLNTMFPQYKTHICESIGHTELVSMKCYTQLPFVREDLKAMIPFVKGWDRDIGLDWCKL